MKYYLVIALILSSTVTPVWGAQLDAKIRIQDETISPNFSFLRIISIEYPEGGIIADLLRNKNQVISFSYDNGSVEMKSLANMINENFESLPSTVIATDAKLKYRALLNGNQNSAVIEIKMEIIPTIINPVIKENGDSRIIDANWRGLSLDVPLILDTPHGKFDVNNSYGILEIMIPEVMENLKPSDVTILENPLIDSSEILKLPLHRWHSLFDNTAIIASSAQYNFTGKHVITHFSMGECNLDTGFCQDRKLAQEVDLDKKYRIVTVESRDDASIEIEGYVDDSSFGIIETFEASLSAPVNEKPATDDFPATVMYGMAGLALVGGIVMFVFSSRKAKKELDQGQTGIDPAFLRVYETSQSSGGYKTNRGEAYLRKNYSRTAV